MYSYKVEQAIRAASILHQDQLRKGEVQIPYISHIIAITLIIRDYTTDENTIVAALLHDTLEDSDYTVEEMKNDFGPEVAAIVVAVTEPAQQNGTKLSWRDKKAAYVKSIKSAPEAALMVAAADKIHNFRSMVHEYTGDYDRYRRDFWEQDDERLEFYQSVSNILNSRLKNDIVHEFNHTFTEFKDFYRNAKRSK
jgi:(p)ppGpp synthase/HD superfamily hydrolase